MEQGKKYSQTSTKSYTATYTQPVHNFVIWWLYENIWEKITWRIYRLIEKLDWREHDWYYIPLTNRQDLRSHYFREKNRITLSVVEENR